MNKIVFTIFLTTVFIVFGFYYYYRKDSRSKKLFRESLSRDIFFLTFIAPLVAASLFTFLISLIFREGDTEKFFRSDVAILLAMFYFYGMYSASQGIHALAKAFKPQVIKMKDKKLMDLIRFFHGPFSHYASNISISLIGGLLLVFNTNHPGREILNRPEVVIILLCGIILGVCLATAYALGNTIRFMRWFVLGLLVILIYIENTSRDILMRSPLSLVVLTMFTTTSVVLFIDMIGPKKNWFARKVDEQFESVDSAWSNILQ